MITLKQRIGTNLTDSHALLRLYAKLILAVAALLHLYIACANHYYFRTFAYDYGVYNFAWRDFAHLHSSSVPIYLSSHPPTFIQDHFSLTLPLLSPLYWLMAPLFGTYSLLLIQWVFIVIGGWYTLKLTDHLTNKTWLQPVIITYSFLLLGRFTAYQNDFNIVTLGASMWPVFFYAIIREKRALTFFTAIFILVNREDGALGLLFVALFFLFTKWSNKVIRRWTITLAVLAIVYFVAVFTLFLPAIADEYNHFSLFAFSALGKDPLEACRFLLLHPLESLRLLVVNHRGHANEDYIKSGFYFVYLISGGWLLLTRPIYLVPLIPFIAKKMWNDDAYRWGLEGFYSVEICVLLPLLIVMMVANWNHERSLKWLLTGTLLLTLLTTIENLNNLDSRKFNFISDGFRKYSFNKKALNELIQQLPDDAAVCASGKIVPHLPFRDHIYYFPAYEQADYILVFLNDDTFPMDATEFGINVNDVKTSGVWDLVYEDSHILCLKRKVSLWPSKQP